MHKISEIQKEGPIWKPLHVKVLFKYPEFIPNGKTNPMVKFIIADDSASIVVIASGPGAKQISKLIQNGGYYLISAGGVRAKKVNHQYRQITEHPMELWISDHNKIQTDQPLLNIKTCLNFNFTPLSRLSKSEGPEDGCDIIAKVHWRGTEDKTQDGLTFKCIRLEDETRQGANKALNCKLYGDHSKSVKRKGDTVVIHNARIGLSDGDLVVNVNNQSALFVVSNEEDLWMLPDAEKESHKILLTPTKSEKRQSLKGSNVEADNEPSCKKSKVLDQNLTSKSIEASPRKSPNKKNAAKQNITTILELNQLSNGKKRGPINYLVGGVKITECRLRRYVGCKFCQKKLTVSKDQKFYCSGFKCRAKKDEEAEQKICFLLNKIKITDDIEEIQDLVCFNEGIENLMGKPANEYLSDENAEDYLNRLIQRSVFEITITASRTGTPGPDLSKQPWKFVISEIVITKSNPELPNALETTEVFSDDVALSLQEKRIAEVLAQRKELVIKVTPTKPGCEIKRSTNDELKPYQMASNPRGLAILIVIETTVIKGIKENRSGAKEDVRMFTELFDQLHYKTVIWENITSLDLANKIEECQQAYTESDDDSLVIGISSHGFNNSVQLADGVIVNLWTDFIYKFDNKRFPSLIGKPKIFLLGFCQDFLQPKDIRLLHASNRLHQDRQVGPLNCDPDHTDMLILVSNSPGFKSYRSTLVGNHFFRAVAEVFMEHAHDTEIRQLCKMVTKVLFSPLESTSTKKQIPIEISLLFDKDFYFNP